LELKIFYFRYDNAFTYSLANANVSTKPMLHHGQENDTLEERSLEPTVWRGRKKEIHDSLVKVELNHGVVRRKS